MNPKWKRKKKKAAKHWDHKRINKIQIPEGSKQAPDTTRLLKIKNEFHEAILKLNRTSGIWSCSEATTHLGHLLGKDHNFVKLQLIKAGYSWEWI